MNKSIFHINVTSSYFLPCCTRSKSLQQYGEYLFSDCPIMLDLGSALWFIHSYTGCPDARPSLLEAVFMRRRVTSCSAEGMHESKSATLATKKEWADRSRVEGLKLGL